MWCHKSCNVAADAPLFKQARFIPKTFTNNIAHKGKQENVACLPVNELQAASQIVFTYDGGWWTA